MTFSEKDAEDTRLARPVAITDLWDIDGRIDRLEDLVIRLEKIVEALILLQKEETVKGLAALFSEALDQQQKKGNRNGNRAG
jgi:hypothetical protein